MEIAEFLGGGECQNSKTLEPIDKKFGMDDYVGDDSLHTKTQTIASLGAWRHICEISPSRGF